jgi:hypothetical protein
MIKPAKAGEMLWETKAATRKVTNNESFEIPKRAGASPSVMGSARTILEPPCPMPHLLSPIPFVFNFLRTLLHFFALIKSSTLFFSGDSALCVKKRPEVGYPHRFSTWIKMNQAGA